MTETDRSGEETAPHGAGQSSSFQDHLVRALENASKHSDYLYDFIKNGLGREPTALRLAVTMRDSLKQLAQLVRGEDLDARDLRREREAVIYDRVKTILLQVQAGPVGEGTVLEEDLEALLTYIREDAEHEQ